MQLQNSPLLDSQVKRRRAVIALCVFLFVFIVIIMLVDRQAAKKTGEYYDPGSGQTVSDPEGKTPENFGTAPGQAIFLGFSKLLDIGLTKTQLESAQLTLQSYSTANKLNIKEFSVSVKTIGQSVPDSESDETAITTSFTMTIDRKEEYTVDLKSSDTTTVRLMMYDKAGKLVLDSNDILTDTEDFSESSTAQ